MILVKKIQLEYVRKIKIKYFSRVNYKISETSKKFQLGFFFFFSLHLEQTQSKRWHIPAEPAPCRISIQAVNVVICQSYKGHVLEEQQSEDITTFYNISGHCFLSYSSNLPFNCIVSVSKTQNKDPI